MELLNSLLYMLNEMSPYILLGFFIAGLMHAMVPPGAMSRHLSGTGLRSVAKAAAVGVPLPLCSCGVLPAAIAMRRSGSSRAAATSFLIATPQTGVDSIAATWSLLGPAFAVVRPIAALATAIVGGIAVGRSERPAAAAGPDAAIDAPAAAPEARRSLAGKLREGLRYGFVDLVASIGGWLVAGLLLAALITVYVPADFFADLGGNPLLAMLAVLVVAIPMYVCATGSIPIAMSLMLKGLSPGTALVLLMAGPAANFASFTLIAREMGRKAAAIYLASIVAGSMAFGLAIDYLLPARWFALPGPGAAGEGCCSFELLPTVCSALLAALLIVALLRGHRHNHLTVSAMTKQYRVKGMNCSHCQAAVAKSIRTVEGVTAVDVNLSTGVATVEGAHSAAAVRAAVRAAGFDLAD